MCWLGGETPRSGVGCEVEDFGEDHLNGIFRGVMPVMDGTVDV
jgi:hypothetical protein